MKWHVDFLMWCSEEDSRELEVVVEASTSKEAMQIALRDLELKPDELLHSLYAHIGRPT